MAKVMCRKASYDYEILRPVVFEMLDSFLGDRIKAHSRVLIKPNLLAPSSPDKAMLTHPLIVKATVEYVNQKGVRPQLSDSPAMGTFEKVLKESGIQSALNGLDLECREFKRSRIIDVGKPLNKIEIAEDALNADVVINLPKLKTHTHMLLTLGVKNLFGCIVGMKKPEWHLRAGIDREMFARLLITIYQNINPAITIIDGILAMEGQGPGRSGTPKELGIILASDDAIALDMTICGMLGIVPDEMPTNKIARQMGLLDSSTVIEGDFPRIKDFKLPDLSHLIFGPGYLHGFLRKHLVQRPEPDQDACKLCGDCWKYCPANAISRNKQKLIFDYHKCIRCYCCVEVCPQGALKAKDTVPSRMIRKVIERNLKNK
jgi:uncharacterized protein (DUF362 family)/Pyruvate/2-oxoacid:ferredoxin oxidoreductase delta subunit